MTTTATRPTATPQGPKPPEGGNKPAPPEKSRKWGWKHSVATAALASIAVTAAIAVGPKLFGSNEAPDEEPTGTSAPLKPGQEPGSGETNGPVENEGSVEIPAGLDDEALGKFIVEEVFTGWENAGASEALISRAASQNIAMAEAIIQVSEEEAVKRADAVFIPNWDQDPALADDVRLYREGNQAVLTNYAATAWSSDVHPENVEAYRQWQVPEGPVRVISKTATERTLAIDYVEMSNGDKNMIGPLVGNIKGTLTVTVRIVDGEEKIAAMSDVAR